MPNDNGNGQSKSLWWAIGLISSIFFTGSGAVINKTISNSTDIATMKETQSGTRDSIGRIEKDLEHMGNKMDRLLDGQRKAADK